jgi:hypothetical protein
LCFALQICRKAKVSAEYKGRKLKRLLQQTWTGHLDQVRIVTENFNDVMNLLQIFEENDDDTDITYTAIGLKTQLMKPELRFIVTVVQIVLLILNQMNKLLQAENCDLLSTISIADEC